MKKIYYTLFAVAAVVAAASCADVIESPEAPVSDEVTLTINASIDNSTKTYIAHDGSAYLAYWSNKDVLAIAIDDGYGSRKKFTNQSADGEDGSFTGSITGLTAGKHTLSGFYPEGYTVNRSEASFEITIPTAQTIPSLGTFDKSADFLVAKPIEIDTEAEVTSVDMQFRRAGCILKIIPIDNTTESLLDGLKVSSITITSASDIITGRSLKCYIDESNEDKLVSGKGSKSLTVNYAGNDFTINGSNAAYAIVTPNKLSGGVELTIDVVTDNEQVVIHKTVTPSDDILLNASMVKPLKIKINDADVTINNSSIDLDVDSVEVSQESATNLTVANAYTLTNCTDADVTVSYDGSVVTGASVADGTITYSVSANSGYARHGWIGVTVGTMAVQKMDVFQLGNGFSWNFNDSNWADAFSAVASSGTEANFDMTIDHLSLKGSNAKWGTRNSKKYIQFKTIGTTEDNYVKFTATNTGVLKVEASNTGSSNPARAVYVKVGESSPMVSEGLTGTTAVVKEFNITTAGSVVYIYPGENPLCFYSIEFEYKSFEPDLILDNDGDDKDQVNVACDAESGVISYTLSCDDGGSVTAVLDTDETNTIEGLTFTNPGNSTSLSFTLTARTAEDSDKDDARIAHIILTYAMEGRTSVVKNVIINQAAYCAPGSGATTNTYFAFVDNNGSTQYNSRFTVAKGTGEASVATLTSYSAPETGLALSDYSVSTGISAYKKGIKMESNTTIAFTTGNVVSATLEIYAIKKSGNTGIKFNGETSDNLLGATENGAPSKLTYTLSPSTEYTIARGSSECAVILVVLTETVNN